MDKKPTLGRPAEHDVIGWMRRHPSSLKMTYKQIAEASGIPYGAINRQLYLARRDGVIERTYKEIVTRIPMFKFVDNDNERSPTA